MANAIKKTAAIALAAGLTFAGSAGIAAQDAFAQTAPTAPNTAASVPNASDIGTDKVNLTINKRVNPTELRNATGEADPKASGEPLAGVGFTAERINVDITDQDNFNKVAKLANARDIEGARKLGTDPAEKFADTDANGQTSKELPVGAYIITETKTPETTGSEAYVPADPFIVFLPMTSADGKTWNRDVQVYPKNSYARAEKAVVDKDKHAIDKETRDSVTYTLTGIVPAAKEGEKLDWFGLRDAYNDTEIKPDIEKITVKVVSADGSEKKLTSEQFHAAADEGFDSVNDKNLAQGANAGFFVGVDTDVLKPGDKVVVTVNAQLLDGANADQQIENSVREYFRTSTADGGFKKTPPNTPPNTPPGDTPPNETPNDKVTTYVGNLTVYKRGEEKKALEGAEFSVGKCNDDKNDIEGKPIATGKTDKDGKLEFKGLHVTDYVDDAEVEETLRDTYCVKEIKAPAGYSLPKKAVTPLTLTREDHKGLVGEGAAAEFKAVAENKTIENGVVIDNVKKTVPLLPSTGGMGILIVALAGLAIISGGAYAARRNSKSA